MSTSEFSTRNRMRYPPVRAVRWTVSLFAMAAVSAFAQVPVQTPASRTAVINSPKFQAQLRAAYREKNTRTPGMRKLSQDLVFTVRMAKGENIRAGLPGLKLPTIARKDGTVDVEFTATITSTLVSQLKVLGAEIHSVYPSYNSLTARIPVRSLETAAVLPGVGFVKSPSLYVRNAGTAQTEGDKSMRTDELRSTYGLTGAGVKMGVLSDSDDYREAGQTSGDLPAVIDVLSGRSGRPGSGEGTAMMQLAYDVAPGASLGFTTIGASQASFAQNYRDLYAAGATVLSDDIFFLDEPAFQDGPIAKAINDIYTAGGIVFVAAGNENNARSNNSGVWEGDYVEGLSTFDYAGDGTDVHPIHDFPGADPFNAVTSTGFGAATLQWNDPWNNAGTDYDLFCYDPVGGTFYDYGLNINGGSVPPFEICGSEAGLVLFVVSYSGPGRVLRVNQLRGSLDYVAGGQIFGHAAGDKAIGMGAINAALTPQRAFNASDVTTDYSSDGLRRIYYNDAGTLIAPGLTFANAIIRNKPTLAGPDGTVTTVPGFERFFGTSASAPHAMALTALLKQFAPDATPVQLQNALQVGAVDILTAGYDKDSGYGALSGKGAIKNLLETKTLGVTPAAATMTGTTPVTLTLNLGRNAPPSGLTVNVVATGATGSFSVPASFTVAGGSATGTVNIGAVGSGAGTVNLTFTENYSGAALGTASVTRTASGVTISTLGLDRTEVVGAARNVVGTVTLSAAAPSAFAFEITSSNPAAASVPASSAVSTGGTTKTFVITTNPVATDTTVTIGVRKQGTTDAFIQQTFVVRAPKPNSCVPSPTSGGAGTLVTFTVKLDGPAPSGGLT
ncbi:hypothetical protein EON81_21915, partial [bacterium]